MQAPDPVEAILARLMPPALSQGAQFDIEAMIDELAGPEAENVVRISGKAGMKRWLVGSGIAAAIGVLCALLPMVDRSSEPKVASNLPHQSAPGLVLVSESDRVESMTEEGWQDDSEGVAMQTLRMSLVGENRLRDEASGMVVQISEPREEILLMPISTF
jgi:hypothetical protein